jgi:hypothetical protein
VPCYGLRGVTVLELLFELSSSWVRRNSLLHNCENIACRKDEVLLTVVFDLGAAVLAVDDDIADADVERDTLLAVLVETTRANRQDFALLRLLLGGVGDNETGRRGLLGIEGLDENPVLERLDGNRH